MDSFVMAVVSKSTVIIDIEKQAMKAASRKIGKTMGSQEQELGLF